MKISCRQKNSELREMVDTELLSVTGGVGPLIGPQPTAPPAVGTPYFAQGSIGMMPVIPGLPAPIERALGGWAFEQAVKYGGQLITNMAQNSGPNGPGPMALRPLADRTSRWLN